MFEQRADRFHGPKLNNVQTQFDADVVQAVLVAAAWMSKPVVALGKAELRIWAPTDAVVTMVVIMK